MGLINDVRERRVEKNDLVLYMDGSTVLVMVLK